MKNKWSDREASETVSRHGGAVDENLALRTYSSALIGKEKSLVLPGGGNTSVKGSFVNEFGSPVPAIFVKASGRDLASIAPRDHVPLDLEGLRLLRGLEKITARELAYHYQKLSFYRKSGSLLFPSIEALMHAFIPAKFIDHTHADAILILTNQKNGGDLVREAMGGNVAVVDYVKPGLPLAKAAAGAYDSTPDAEGIILAKHGLITWGDTAKESYDRTISLVTRAEEFIKEKSAKASIIQKTVSPEEAAKKYIDIAPIIRGVLAVDTGDPDVKFEHFIIDGLITGPAIDFVNSSEGKKLALTPPLTADHLVRIKPLPLWMDNPDYSNPEKFKESLGKCIDIYSTKYGEYFKKHGTALPDEIKSFDSKPRLLFLPGLGVVCAGRDANEARMVKDIAEQTISAKKSISLIGEYDGLTEEDLFDMEYFELQLVKLVRGNPGVLQRRTALVTGAAGAIGSGICEELLREGAHVAAADLPGENLDSLAANLQSKYGRMAMGVEMDVTDAAGVKCGFDEVIKTWGGIDIVVANAGCAYVSPLESMDPDEFRKTEKVNIEGTLNTLSESASRFALQGTGGDIVFISTKNVFVPGAGFGAYSATKAAAHQLARIASMEFADMGVRVNMIAPDAVFKHGSRRSGLWAEAGSERMRSRGLDAKDLENYYQNRNLLKARITATHVGRAVVFFVSHQTPTTGATLPVDGGLPGAAPR